MLLTSTRSITSRSYSMANIYYVYTLIDPRSNRIFYVGEGKGKRAWSHQVFKSCTNNPHKDRVIQKIHSSGLEVIVKIIKENLTKAQSVEYESLLIEEIGLENLTNICKDANPPVLCGSSNGFYGKTHTAETKVKLGLVNKGKDIKTAEGKESIRQSMINRWIDPNQRRNQIEALKKRKGEKRSKEAIEAYKKAATERESNMTDEQKQARKLALLKSIEASKASHVGMKRKSYIDEDGRRRFKWIPCAE